MQPLGLAVDNAIQALPGVEVIAQGMFHDVKYTSIIKKTTRFVVVVVAAAITAAESRVKYY